MSQQDESDSMMTCLAAAAAAAADYSGCEVFQLNKYYT